MNDPLSSNPGSPNEGSAAHQHNRRAWDSMVQKGQRFTKPAKDDQFRNPLVHVDALNWLGGNIRGRKLLCLAAGGGKHGPLYAAAGAEVTVVDISPAMLELDRQVAAERDLKLRTVEASMDAMPMLTAGEFDIVIHPVSTCYVPEVQPVFREIARITRTGGQYISQHKSPTSLQADIVPSPHGYELIEPYYREGPLPPVVGSRHREEGTLEFLHRWEDILGGICKAGFAIEDFIEPLHADLISLPGDFGHRSRYVAPYVRIKARRTGDAASPAARIAAKLWTP